MNYLLQVTSQAMPGRDDDYNIWYENTHMIDVLGLDGFNACTRYMYSGPGHEGPPKYVALYEVVTDDPPALLQDLVKASATMQISDSIDPKSVRFEFLQPIGGGRKTAG
ncbi:MAG: hypothetical protein ACK5NN_15770 [Sphingomonadaceae bacterium]